jgi:hypothetical protein
MSSSDLDQLRAAACPRDTGLCDALAARYEPGRATVVRLGWVFVDFALAGAAALVVIMIAMAATGHMGGQAGPARAPAWLVPLCLGTFAAAFIYAWIGLERHLKRRREEVAALFRDGQFIDAMPSGVSSFGTRAGSVQRISFTFDGADRTRSLFVDFARDVRWPDNQALPILYREGSRLCAVFPHADGRMMPRTLR